MIFPTIFNDRLLLLHWSVVNVAYLMIEGAPLYRIYCDDI